jgi:SAM-dependent methyltransferase
MSEMYVEGDYLRLNPTWNVEHSAWKARLIRDLLDENLVQFKKIIEIGCGAGQILVQLSKIFPSKFFVGYDISPQAYELAKEFESKNVKFQMGDYLKESESIEEVIICSDVFEHVEDYFGFLKSLSKKSELIVFHIPLDLSLVSILIPEILLKSRRNVGHLHYFNKEIAEATLVTCGYKIIDSRITAGCLEFPDGGMLGRTYWIIRKFCNYISPSITARVFGGFSLLVLAAGA